MPIDSRNIKPSKTKPGRQNLGALITSNETEAVIKKLQKKAQDQIPSLVHSTTHLKEI